MKITEKKLKDIKPYENNPRKNDNAVTAIKNSIKEFGFKVPIVIDKDGIIITGHTRYKAAVELGLKTVPCITADDLTEDQANAYRLADNKTGEMAKWDYFKLSEEIEKISGINLDDYGFDIANEIEAQQTVGDFFVPAAKKMKKKKTIICQKCGKEFEV